MRILGKKHRKSIDWSKDRYERLIEIAFEVNKLHIKGTNVNICGIEKSGNGRLKAAARNAGISWEEVLDAANITYKRYKYKGRICLKVKPYKKKITKRDHILNHIAEKQDNDLADIQKGLKEKGIDVSSGIIRSAIKKAKIRGDIRVAGILEGNDLERAKILRTLRRNLGSTANVIKEKENITASETYIYKTINNAAKEGHLLAIEWRNNIEKRKVPVSKTPLKKCPNCKHTMIEQGRNMWKCKKCRNTEFIED